MFRFSIRELVLVTALVAMALAWSQDHSYWRSQAQWHRRFGAQGHREANLLANEVARLRSELGQVNARGSRK